MTEPAPTQVFLVAAGSGDPLGISVRGGRCLERAGAVFYPVEALGMVARWANPSAELICLDGPPPGEQPSPEDVAGRILEAVRQGQVVVRLYADLGRGATDLADEARSLSAAGAALEVVAGLAAQAQSMDRGWLRASAPLAGRRVLVTRPRTQAGPLCDRLADLGAEALVQPVIRIEEPRDWRPVDAAFARLDQFDWLVFSSANGVRALLDRLLSLGHDLRALGRIKLSAIGPGTAEELLRYHLRADLVPEQYRAESLAEALAHQAAGSRFLLARASRGREVLAEALAAAGGQVQQIVVYTSVDVERPAAEIAALLAAGRIDWVTVTSSAIARSLVRLFGEDLRRTRLASISPITSQTLRELGHEPAAEAIEYTMEGVVAALVKNG